MGKCTSQTKVDIAHVRILETDFYDIPLKEKEKKFQLLSNEMKSKPHFRVSVNNHFELSVQLVIVIHSVCGLIDDDRFKSLRWILELSFAKSNKSKKITK